MEQLLLPLNPEGEEGLKLAQMEEELIPQAISI
jgi:hypothetical protein